MRLDGVFEGGKRILQMMKPGATWFVSIPPDLAFVAVGQYPDVGPNEALILTVDLLEINHPGGGRTR